MYRFLVCTYGSFGCLQVNTSKPPTSKPPLRCFTDVSRTWLSHITHEWVISCCEALLRATPLRCLHDISHVRLSHVTHMNESRIWMSHVTRTNESCHTYECVTSHIWMSHVTHMNASCHTYDWVMPHVRLNLVTLQMSPVSHMDESRHTDICVMFRIWNSHVSHMGNISQMCVCAFVCAFVRAFVRACVCLCVCEKVSCEGFIASTHVHICVHIPLRHLQDMSRVRFSNVTMNESLVTYEWVLSHVWSSHMWAQESVMCHVWMSHVTRMNESCQIVKCYCGQHP